MKIKEIIEFLKDVKEELKKVTWPTREQVKKATVAVIIFTTLMSLYLWALDLIFQRLFNLIFK